MPPQHFNRNAVLHDLANHNDFFDELVDSIPAKLYVSGNTGDDKYNPKYRKGQHKESKEARRARNKASYATKFDPAARKTTREEKILKEAEDFAMSDDDDDDEMDPTMPQQDTEMETEEESPPPSSPPSSSSETTTSIPDPGSSKIEQLRAKLRAKLEERRSQRPGSQGQSDTMVSKRAARRAEKQKRIELAKRKKASGSTQTGRTKNGKVSLVTKDLGGSTINSADGSKMDDLAGIDFGGISGLKELDKNYGSSNKSLKNMGKKKSLERLLEEAEAKKKRLKELKASGDTEDKEKAKKMEWGDALKAASGDQTKDADPTLLKKAIKRKAKKKAKSQDAWKSRMEQTKEKMDERQKIRSHNIGKRAIGGIAGANLSKKRIAEDDKEADGADGKKKRARLGPHSGKSRAGFEGKKQDFINKGGKTTKNIASQ